MGNDTSTKLSIVIDAENKTDAVFKQINDNMKTTSDRMKNISDVSKKVAEVGAVSFAAVAGVIYTTVSAAGEAQVKMAQFNSTMDTMGKKGTEAKKALLEAANASVKKGFDDEDSANSLAKLYQRTGDVTKATKLNNLAMDLSRAKNIDLTTASNLVSMALSGSGKALLQYGIVIKDSATPMEALSTLQDKVGGQADAFASTFAGNMAVMKVETDNLKESIGNALLPVLTDMLKKIEPIITKVTEWVEKHPELTKNILLGAAAFTGFATILGIIGVAIGPIAAGIAGINTVLALSAVVPATLILVALAAAIIAVGDAWIKTQAVFDKNKKVGEDAITQASKLDPLIAKATGEKKAQLEKIKADTLAQGKENTEIGNLGFFGAIGYGLGISGPKENDLTPLSNKTGNQTVFNFNGDVNDKDALMKNIKSMLDRQSSLVQIGA